MLYFIISLLLVISLHELGHLLVAIWLGIKVDAYSIGFGKPIWKRTWKGIEWRIAPILLGGYVSIKGENSRENPDDFLNHPYWKKFLTLIAGCTVNILTALICYLINYGSIKTGFIIDWEITKAIFLKQDLISAVGYYIYYFKPNLFLLQLSLMSITCGIVNLLFFLPPTDGGLVWYLAIDKHVPKKIENILFKFGWFLVIGIQIWLLYYIYIMK